MADILRESWPHGGIYIETIRLNDKLYDEDFTRLAAYMTKGEHTEGLRSDGTPAKPRIREASYSTSRNMPLTDPETEKTDPLEERAPDQKRILCHTDP